jgi:hypothetical protein
VAAQQAKVPQRAQMPQAARRALVLQAQTQPRAARHLRGARHLRARLWPATPQATAARHPAAQPGLGRVARLVPRAQVVR